MDQHPAKCYVRSSLTSALTTVKRWELDIQVRGMDVVFTTAADGAATVLSLLEPLLLLMELLLSLLFPRNVVCVCVCRPLSVVKRRSAKIPRRVCFPRFGLQATARSERPTLAWVRRSRRPSSSLVRRQQVQRPRRRPWLSRLLCEAIGTMQAGCCCLCICVFI